MLFIYQKELGFKQVLSTGFMIIRISNYVSAYEGKRCNQNTTSYYR